jgi:hypothetical protein
MGLKQSNANIGYVQLRDPINPEAASLAFHKSDYN